VSRPADELRFDGRVAVVTGAGGNPGLGRAHAMLLAARGARVLVNDLGVGPDGRGAAETNAEAVAAEIRAAGGEAIANTDSVAELESARRIVDDAIGRWGRIDILINNAGVVHLAKFEEIDPRDIELVTRVHLLGTVWMCKAAWPHMREAGYGRMLNTASGAALGQEYTTIYGAAKGGIISLTAALAVEAEAHGIVVNSIAPAAATRALTHSNVPCDPFVADVFRDRPPELVALTAAYLVHERCTVSGRCFDVGSGPVPGRTSELYWMRTRGYVNAERTVEAVAQHIDDALDRSDPETPVRGRAPFTPRPYRPPAQRP
jgi:NAD(P)-dependent dehydrogenase (short-subunit alcohol dehydrogenase family)